ncbi:MAG TPA: FmdB family zinc ribbon protein [Pyrinomonadaceae bacterium]|nr:FmdB family zinc ribbon protein [Pyrinomonadaceae bacterium]
MPIYEYSCKKCGAHLEVMQKISDAPLARHAKCGGKLEKEWSRTGFQFKGSGWYVTDYAGKKSDSSESSESKSETKETKPEPKESKSDSSEAKSESKAKGSKSKKDAAATSGD